MTTMTVSQKPLIIKAGHSMEPCKDLYTTSQKDAAFYHCKDANENELPFFLQLSVFGGELLKEKYEDGYFTNQLIVAKQSNFRLSTFVFKSKKAMNEYKSENKHLMDENHDKDFDNIESIFNGWKPKHIYKKPKN